MIEAEGPTPEGRGFVFRRVRSLDELRQAFDVVGALFAPAISHEDARFVDLLRRFEADRALMVIAVRDGDIVGGAFGFRKGDAVTLRMLGVVEGLRRCGVARRLVQVVEVEAMRLGARSISLGAERAAKPFYEALGYHGRSSMHKALPLPGRVLERRLLRLSAALGDLDVGEWLAVTPEGRVPSLM